MRRKKFIAFEVGDPAGWELLPARPKRRWMEETPLGFAARCLPLTIANQAGWVITCPVGFVAEWNGSENPSGVGFSFEAEPDRYASQIRSHFGSGIVTFSVPYLFRTPAGIGLLARGLPNEPKDNCSALEGLVETDWATSTFTMNWKIHRPRVPVAFSSGEPICFLQPIDLRTVEGLEPTVRGIDSVPVMAASYLAWRTSRQEFNASSTRGSAWQKHYHQGVEVDGQPAKLHRTSLSVRPFLREGDAMLENNDLQRMSAAKRARRRG